MEITIFGRMQHFMDNINDALIESVIGLSSKAKIGMFSSLQAY